MTTIAAVHEHTGDAGADDPQEASVKHTRKKRNQGLVTKIITYRDGRHPTSNPPQKLTIDVHRDDVLDADYLAAVVTVRTGTPLNQVRIIEVNDQ